MPSAMVLKMARRKFTATFGSGTSASPLAVRTLQRAVRFIELFDAFLPGGWGLADKRPNFMRRLKPIYRYLPLGVIIIAQTAFAADADNGKRLALLRCSSCHVVMRNQRNEVAESPPFDAIAENFGSNFELLYSAVRDPHPRMNMVITRREAEDIAAYISTLAK